MMETDEGRYIHIYIYFYIIKTCKQIILFNLLGNDAEFVLMDHIETVA